MKKPKIVIIGGGSAIWTRNIIHDIIYYPALHGSEIVLMDIDEQRLLMVEQLCVRLSQENEAGLRISSTLNRKDALKGADYVIVQIAVGGIHAWKQDLDIPWELGRIYQTVGDTTGPGGVFRAFRNIPVINEIAKEMEQLCPNAWMIQLTNPMTTICRALDQTSPTRVIGYCHGVNDSERIIAEELGIETPRVRIYAYGINHFLFLKSLQVDGVNAEETLEQLRGGIREKHPVLGEMWDSFGLYPINYPVHPCEFVPFYLKEGAQNREEWKLDQHIPDWLIGANQSLIDNVKSELARTDKLDVTRTREQIADIIESLHTNRDIVLHLNIRNNGAILNLPPQNNVEVPALVNRRGVHPLVMGELPAGVASMVRRIAEEQELIVEACLTGSPELAVQALALDPLVADIGLAKRLFSEAHKSQKQYWTTFA